MHIAHGIAFALVALAVSPAHPAQGFFDTYSAGGKVYQAFLSAGAVVNPSPDCVPHGSGRAVFRLKASTKVLYGTMNASDFAISPKVYGPALSGSNGPLLFAFPVSGGVPQPVVFGPLTPAQEADLDAGKWYVEAHDCPPGYVDPSARGQIQRDDPGQCASVSAVNCTVARVGAANLPVTVAPYGSGGGGNSIDVWVRDASGNPLVNLARDSIRAVDPSIASCAIGYTATEPTDDHGHTYISAVSGFGCSTQLTVMVGGTSIGSVTVPARGPDIPPASPGVIAANDALLLIWNQSPAPYYPCADLNGDGIVNAVDLSAWATSNGSPYVCLPTAQ